MSWPRFRFSLATLLCLFTIAAIACVWFLHQRQLNQLLQTTRDQVAFLSQNQTPTSDPVNETFAYAVFGKETNGGRRLITREDYVGKRVQVEGVAWGQPFGSETNSHSPWTQAHVSFEGGEIFVRGADFVKDSLKGKLVRATGILKDSPAVASRFGTRPKYYYIEVDSYERIEMVEEPLLLALEEIDIPWTWTSH